MIRREIEPELITAANEYPVTTIFGPRQSGKTTLVKMVFPKHKYVSLEMPSDLVRAEEDPRAFLDELGEQAVLDEVQRAPFLLSYIQGIVDQRQQEGAYILTGSHQPSLGAAVSQSLAGRTAILELLPFSPKEIATYKRGYSTWELVLLGGYPRLYEKQLNHSRFFNSYIRTYIERDVRQLLAIRNASSFQKLLMLLAGRVGNIINYSSLCSDTGISSTTVKEWLSVMESSYVLFQLSPFYENIRKRVIKSPKIYFYDTGLVSHLLGIQTSSQLKRDPLRGAIFENAVILNIIKGIKTQGGYEQIFFFRDSNGNEVDLIIKSGRQFLPIEIKSASTFNTEFLKGIKTFRKLLGEKCGPAFLLYNGEERFNINEIQVFNPFLHNFDIIFRQVKSVRV